MRLACTTGTPMRSSPSMRKIGHLGAGGHGGAEGVGHRLEVSGAQAEALSRSSCMGMCRTPGGPLTASSSTARAILRGDAGRVLEGGADGVEVERRDDAAVALHLLGREGDGFVERLVGGDGEVLAALVLVHLEGVAAEEGAAAFVVQHRLAFVVAADVVEGEAGAELERVVVGPGDAEGLGHAEVFLLDRQHLRPEHVLQLPERAVAVAVGGGEEADAAEALDLGEHVVRVEGRGLEGDVAVLVQQQPAGAVQAEGRRGGEGDHVARAGGANGRWSIPRTSAAGRKCQPSCGRSLRVSVQTGQSGGGAKYFCQWPQLEQA